jgi:hypothetical protein
MLSRNSSKSLAQLNLRHLLVLPVNAKILAGGHLFLNLFVPLRVKDIDQFIALQLTENLQREDLNPIDQAQGVLSYFRAKQPERSYDVDGVMSELVSYDRRPEGADKGFAANVAAITQVCGISTKTLFN